MDGFVYIIQSSIDGMYYVGSTIDIVNRLRKHNNKQVQSTKSRVPWVLKFTQKYDTIAEARRIEHKLKKLKRRDIIERIIKDNKIKLK